MPKRLPAMDDAPADAARVGRCSITLVHGTWGRGFFPKISELRRRYLFRGTKWWFEEGSQFRARLDEALNGASLDRPIRAFLWSGANSVHDRDCAARELSQQLRKDLQDPDATAVIIAHSHGGNVALRALQHLGAGRIRVVTLATPFLRVFARKSDRLPIRVNFLLFIGVWAIGFVISIAILANYWSTVSDNYWYEWPGVAGPLAAGAVGGSFIVRWLNAFFVNPLAANTIAKAADYHEAAPHMLVLRGVDDEASLSLAAGSIGSRLSYLVLVGALPLIFWMAFLLSMFVPWDGGFLLPSLLASSCILGAFMFLILPGVFKSAFGREFLLNGINCDIAVDSVPETVDKVGAKTLPPVEAASFLQMRHGIYNHPDCVDEIVHWLRRVT